MTARPGGIDVLLTGLSHQDFDDFELVLVDTWYHKRKELVADYFHDARIRVVHTPSRYRSFPTDAIPAARNTGLARVSGELVLWLVDYTYLPPRVLKAHWDTWEASGRTINSMAAHWYAYPPPTAYELPAYAPCVAHPPSPEKSLATYVFDPEAIPPYLLDVHAGFYDAYGYSIFTVPITQPKQVECLKEDPYFYHVDPKLDRAVGGQLPGAFFHAKNETVPAGAAFKVNGFDENYIGHSYDDIDFGARVGNAGVKWRLLGPEAQVVIVNPRHYFPHLTFRGPGEGQRALLESRQGDPTQMWAKNTYDLTSVYQGGPWFYI